MLSDDDSDIESVNQLTINEHFAKAYARKKEREVLSKLKEKYGSDVDEDDATEEDSEEDTTEDEDGEELTPAVDAAILRTLARIKRKDPSIYEAGKDVFDEEQQKVAAEAPSISSQKNKDKAKPLLLRQHVLNSQLRSSRSPSPVPEQPTHAEEQAALRKETISAFHTAVSAGDEEDEDEDDILIPREKTKDEIEREEEEYREFLKRQVGEDIARLVTVDNDAATQVKEESDELAEVETKGEKKKKKRKNRKSKEEEDHEFLINYILNRGWIDRSARHIPTYGEITGSKKSKKSKHSEEAGKVEIIGGSDRESDGGDNDRQPESLDEEEEFDEIADNFESSYNFRFEEPDAAIIPTHPRNIASTVRREENPRKAARERKKERKEEKLLQKKEEVKRLKALKMKEIREKLERIGREGGKSADDEALAQLDLEGDWDPEAHDRQMAGIYGDDTAPVDGEDFEKPTWDDDVDITDIVPPEEDNSKKKKKDKKKRKKDTEYEEEGVDVDEMDVDVLEAEAKGEKRKLADEDLDELYALDFNSMVGDMPTRFKYTPVLPQTYGLSATEILLADDKELNEYVGLRKVAAPYRKDKGRTWDAKRAEKLKELRKKIGERTGKGEGALTNGVEGHEGGEAKKKRKGKKERLKAKLAEGMVTEGDQVGIGQHDDIADASEDGHAARQNGPAPYGEEPRPAKRKRKHKTSNAPMENS